MGSDTGYKKRAKGHWQCGKGCKGDSEERQYAKREIAQALKEAEEGYLERYHKGARTKNERARLEYRISWYTQALAADERRNLASSACGNVRSWSSSFSSYLRDGLRKAKKELRDKFGEGSDDT